MHARAEEERIVQAMDEAERYGRSCTPSEMLAKLITECGSKAILRELSEDTIRYFIARRVPIEDDGRLIAWARKTWEEYLRDAAKLNFLSKIAEASGKLGVKGVPDMVRVMDFVIAKPKQQTELSGGIEFTGKDGGPIETAFNVTFVESKEGEPD